MKNADTNKGYQMQNAKRFYDGFAMIKKKYAVLEKLFLVVIVYLHYS